MTKEERQEAVNMGGPSNDVTEGDVQIHRQTARVETKPSET